MWQACYWRAPYRASENSPYAWRSERARAAFDAWGVAWDKRLALPRWRRLAELVARDGQARDAEAEVAGWPVFGWLGVTIAGIVFAGHGAWMLLRLPAGAGH